jgi:DNA-binding winged helix-turn-helix (wHTH) protein/tetratricopeptide (TPR) repeat protein
MLFAFDDFTLNLDALELRRRGVPIALQRLPLDLLLYLVRHRDRVVTKDELFEQVWKGIAVGDGALNQAIAVVRRALGERRSEPRLIQTVRARGYRFTGEVREVATHARLPLAEGAAPPRTVDAETAFIGRHDVMRLLDAALEDSLRGQVRLVLVSGLPGMGKTRICEEFAATGSRRGLQALSGACTEGAPPYWPWIQILQQIHAFGPHRDDRTRATIEALLAKLSPKENGNDGTWAALDEPAARAQFFDRFSHLGVQILRRTPMLLMFDDLHVADLASLELLHFLAQRAGDQPILFLGTYRQREARRNANKGAVIERLAHLAGALSHELTGMQDDEVARLFHSVSGARLEGAALQALRRRTGGNPFFVKELARLQPAQEHPIDARALPSGVADAVRQHIDTVTRRCRETLATASALGFDFDAPLLAAAMGRELALVLEELDEAVSAGLVVQTRGAGVGYRFAHMLVCEVISESLPPARRAAVHASIGKAIEALPDAAETFLTELAEHFYRAAVYEPVACVRYARRAALRAMRSFAFEEAVRHYQRALEVFPYAGEGEKARARLLLGLGIAHARTGDFEQAQPILRQAMDTSRALGEREMLAWAAYGFCLFERSDLPVPAVISVLQETLAVYDEPTPLRVLLLAQLADALWFVPPIEHARARALEAVELGRAVDQPEALAKALSRAHRIWIGPAEEIDRRFALSSEIERLRPRIRDPQTLLESYWPSLCDSMLCGDRVGFDRAVDALSRQAAEIDQPFAYWHATVYEAARAHLGGHFDRAEALARRARAGTSPGGKVFAEHVFAIQFLMLSLDRGRPADAVPLLEQRASSERELPWRLNLARCRVALGKTDEARRLVAEVVAQLADIPRNIAWMDTLCCLAALCVALKLRREGAAVYDELLPFEPYHELSGGAWVHRGSVARPLGNLAALGRHWDIAYRHFERAIENDRRFGAVACVARNQYDYAFALLSGGGSRATANDLLSQASEIAREIGFEQLRAEAERLLRGRSSSSGTNQPASSPA